MEMSYSTFVWIKTWKWGRGDGGREEVEWPLGPAFSVVRMVSDDGRP